MKQKNGLSHRFKKPKVQLMAAALLFLMSAFWVQKDIFRGAEEVVFRFVYELPEFLTPFFLVLTQLGSVMVLFALAAMYLIKQHYHIVLRLLLSGLLAYLLAHVAKEVLGRPRPGELLANVVYRDYVTYGVGFPSAHVALVTAIAFTVREHVPRRQHWILWASIVGVALSRIYLGVHAPIDVIGGFAIGWFASEIFRFVHIKDRSRL